MFYPISQVMKMTFTKCSWAASILCKLIYQYQLHSTLPIQHVYHLIHILTMSFDMAYQLQLLMILQLGQILQDFMVPLLIHICPVLINKLLCIERVSNCLHKCINPILFGFQTRCIQTKDVSMTIRLQLN